MHNHLITTLLISFLLCTQLANGQLKNEEKEGYLWFDHALGAENINLYNGLVYIEKYKTINDKHKFFSSRNSLVGSIIHKGQPYYNVKMKYDLFEDQILVMTNNLVQLINEHIASFTINGSKFVNIDTQKGDTRSLSGFYEILTETPSYSLYKKHCKRKIDRMGQKAVYSEFIDDNQFYVHYSGAYHKINTKRDMIKIFPEFKREIKAYAKRASRTLDLESYILNTLAKINIIKSETSKLAQ